MDITILNRRIDRARAIADDERANPDERASAARLLKRLLASRTREAQNGWADRRVYGDKAHQVRGLSLTEIAKLIRKDLAVARKMAAKYPAAPGDLAIVDPIGDAPAQIKFGVRTQYYSGGGSIDIIVRNIPDDWGWIEVEEYGYTRQMPSEALRTLGKELHKVHFAYNYDGSDITTDYFDRRYMGGVGTQDGLML